MFYIISYQEWLMSKFGRIDEKILIMMLFLLGILTEIEDDIDSLYKSSMDDFGEIASGINSKLNDSTDLGVYGKVKFSAEFR